MVQADVLETATDSLMNWIQKKNVKINAIKDYTNIANGNYQFQRTARESSTLAIADISNVMQSRIQR